MHNLWNKSFPTEWNQQWTNAQTCTCCKMLQLFKRRNKKFQLTEMQSKNGWKQRASERENIIIHYTVYWITIIYWTSLIANTNSNSETQENIGQFRCLRLVGSFDGSLDETFKVFEFVFDFKNFYKHLVSMFLLRCFVIRISFAKSRMTESLFNW